MKRSILVVICLSGLAVAQEKPRVFVQGKGSQDVTTTGSGGGGRHWGTFGANTTVDSHDEAMEVSKDLQKDCPGLTMTLNQTAADYTVMLNRESKHNRGLLRTNNQIEVANRLGDVLGTNATRSVGSASKDACELIMADWSQHGRLAAPGAAAVPATAPAAASAPVAAPVASSAPAAQSSPATAPQGATLQTVSAIQGEGAVVAAPAAAPDGGTQSLADAAKHQRQLKACLEMAKDNPSIVCK